MKIGPITAITNASWEASRLTIAYDAGGGRVIRYAYSAGQSPTALIVEVEFIDGRGIGDRVRRVYEKAPTASPPSTSAAPRDVAPPPTTFPASSPSASAPIDSVHTPPSRDSIVSVSWWKASVRMPRSAG